MTFVLAPARDRRGMRLLDAILDRIDARTRRRFNERFGFKMTCHCGKTRTNNGLPLHGVRLDCCDPWLAAQIDGDGCDIPGCDHKRSNRGYDMRPTDG